MRDEQREPTRAELLVRAWVSQLMEQGTLDVLDAAAEGKVDVTLSASGGNLRRPVIKVQT